jgi:acyl transferase domain-containing protein
MPRKKPKKKAEPAIAGVLGIGLDGTDGHQRITRTEEMVLVAGSAETHERMQETAIRFAEELEKRGKRLQDIPAPEAIDMLREAMERTN